jgi:hypothetical protein
VGGGRGRGERKELEVEDETERVREGRRLGERETERTYCLDGERDEYA